MNSREKMLRIQNSRLRNALREIRVYAISSMTIESTEGYTDSLKALVEITHKIRDGIVSRIDSTILNEIS